MKNMGERDEERAYQVSYLSLSSWNCIDRIVCINNRKIYCFGFFLKINSGKLLYTCLCSLEGKLPPPILHFFCLGDSHERSISVHE